MGWDFTKGATKQDIVERRTQDSGHYKCLAHRLVGRNLWTVWETLNEPETKRFIGLDLLDKDRNFGWGYKDMTEAMHPYYYDCPEEFLQMVPPVCPEWRTKVATHHARIKQKKDFKANLRPGDRILLSTGMEVTIKTIGRSMTCEHKGMLYRLQPKALEGAKILAKA
jgi:hypothetical protein